MSLRQYRAQVGAIRSLSRGVWARKLPYPIPIVDETSPSGCVQNLPEPLRSGIITALLTSTNPEALDALAAQLHAIGCHNEAEMATARAKMLRTISPTPGVYNPYYEQAAYMQSMFKTYGNRFRI